MTRRVAVQFIAELASFKRGMRGGADEVRKVKAEAVAAQREVAGLGEVGEKAGRQLGDGIVRGADGKLRHSKGRFVKAGQESGQGFGDGFEQGSRKGLLRVSGMLGGGLLKAGGNAPWLGLAAIPATAGAAAASLQAIPPLLATIGGTLGAVPALAVGAAASIKTVKFATEGLAEALGEAFTDERDPFLRLSHNGQAFVAALAVQKRALLDLRAVGQNTVFAGLDAEVANLAAVALPFAGQQVQRFGATWNTTFKQVAALGRDGQFLSGLDDAFGAADGFFDKINVRIPATGQALGKLFTGSVPFVDQFGSSLLDYVDDFNSWIDRSAQSGKLESFFEDAADQADALLDLSREILVIVGRIGGMQSGSTLLRDMADAVERFNREAHNMQSVEGIIRTGNAAIAGVVDVLAVLGSTLGETLADPGTTAAVALFFDVLKVGAQIIGGLAQTFALLHDDVQAFVLVGAALAIVGGKLSAVFGKAHTALGGFGDRLRETGTAGAKTADWMGRAEKAAVRFGAAMVAAQLASAAFGASLNPQLEGLARNLDQFARTGKVAGEMTRLFGDDMGKLDTALKDIADTGAWSDFARGTGGVIEGLTGLGAVFDDSVTKSRERIGALDSALTDMAASGGMDQARAAFDRIAESAQKQGVSTAELMKVLPGYAAAVEKAKAAGDGQAQAAAAAEQKTRLLTGSMQDAISTMGSYTRAWQVLNGAVLSSDEALLGAIEATNAVKEAFKENGRAISGNSEKAVANRVAVGQAAQAYAEAAQKKYEETGSIRDANAVYDQQIVQLRKTLSVAGLTKTQIDTLVGAYAKMPKSVVTTVTADTDQAKQELAKVGNLIRQIRSKKVVITTQHNQVVTRSEGRNVPIGAPGGRRWGGVDAPVAMAAGGMLRADVYRASNPPLIKFAEPETGGEAYIPRRGDRERSISIGRRAMEWYGMDVVPKSTISGSYASAMSSQWQGQARQAPLDVAALAGAVRAALLGVGVVMDGRVVGQVTGRQADIYART